MSESTNEPQRQLERGTYEILRGRLQAQGKELRQRLATLNERRKEIFGSVDVELVGTERITTDHNCFPRDIVAIGDQLLFGYNVHFGLKTERNLVDVFAQYKFREGGFHTESLSLLSGDDFAKDFRDIYRYYKDARFARFVTKGPHLFLQMQVGKSATDFKTLKWLNRGGEFRYLDNRSDHEVKDPPQHEFEWKRTTREQHIHGLHPHVNILDRVFVETVGGDLTVKVEDNTDSGEGIYAEPVDNPDQVLDDAEIHYATVGNLILMRVRPYQEQEFRYLVFNDKQKQVTRIDAIANACVLLPEDQGLIFPNGYYLQTGDYKTFDGIPSGTRYRQRILSPNGEDFLYVFYEPLDGTYVLLRYNLIAQQVDTPLICNGFTVFDGGELICFKAHEEPQKHHAIQIWQTPFSSEAISTPEVTESFLGKIGNRDLVRGMGECQEVLSLLDKDDSYENLYVDLVRTTTDIIDSYFWIGREEAADLRVPLDGVRDAAQSAIDEYEKVVRIRRTTEERTLAARQKVDQIRSSIGRRRFDEIQDFVDTLGELRAARGEVIGLRDLKYVELDLVDELERSLVDQAESVSRRTVEFLLKDDALKPFIAAIQEASEGVPQLETVAAARSLGERIDKTASELEMLIEVVSNLDIDDATKRTQIIDDISSVFASVNRTRSSLKNRRQELASVEGRAEFASQMKLISQSVAGYLDVADTPERCDEFLTKLMVQLEELEGRFAEFPEFIGEISLKREEIYDAFESRKLSLVEARNRRANSLAEAADRILKGVKNKSDSFDSIADINGYFASDLMVGKVRDVIKQLSELGDAVKSGDIQSQLKSAQEDAVRQLKDRKELFVDGRSAIRFGRHRFSVNTQPLDLTIVPKDDQMQLHLTGTGFFEPIDDEDFLKTRDVWGQDTVSETKTVYRAEFLAYLMAGELTAEGEDAVRRVLDETHEDRVERVAKFMAPRYSEGYQKGVHDKDAALVLETFFKTARHLDLLRYRSRSRTVAELVWEFFVPKRDRLRAEAQLKGVGTVDRAFSASRKQNAYRDTVREVFDTALALSELEEFLAIEGHDRSEAIDYLVDVLAAGRPFAIAAGAETLAEHFKASLRHRGTEDEFRASTDPLKKSVADLYRLTLDWVEAFALQEDERLEFVEEAALLLLNSGAPGSIADRVINADPAATVKGLVGSHQLIESGEYQFHYNNFVRRLEQHSNVVAPLFRSFGEQKKDLVDAYRDDLRLEEFRPRVLTSFVRNRLLDEVYLPLIGDNFAKQIGTAGDDTRTDRMGLLLLVSPPGYGKTTLMEYVANRLGIIFMKINGPALGHSVTAIDPMSANNAAAREELEKLNLAFEMGDNILIYLDDIQHCHPEFLQKFISLCDAQRKIEGVWKGESRQYDFRGKKVAVVMAGNPYTESGEQFKIPDMLANRADIYNLGEIIGDNGDAFESSYIENSLTSNPTLAPLATASRKDIYGIMRVADRGNADGVEFEGNFSPSELNEYVGVMRKLLRVRDVVLKVNQEYIRSAAQADDYRTEPPFLLQGSYRNMNRIAEKIAAVMNDEEMKTLILSNYQNDAQTLTSGTEANLLKFKELMGWLTIDERQRWEDIKRTFKENVKLRGVDPSDSAGQVIAQLTLLGDGLREIEKAVGEGAALLAKPEDVDATVDWDARITPHLEQLHGSIRSVGETFGSVMEKTASSAPATVPTQNGNNEELMQLLRDEIRLVRESIANAAVATAVPEDVEADDEDEKSAPPKPMAGPASVVDNADDAPSGSITVVNKIPPTLLNVLVEQFRLMENWMKPLMEMSLSERRELKDLENGLRECLKDYERLLGRLKTARRKKRRSRGASSPDESSEA
ncbi:DNA repair ATPase [Stratiformator vulcanicus]|uniref:ATPase involved in DNA repair n=1 Tax=Stratiformator vulcanicus TaxID=2527980 RepID=A0A517R415_9PLAN|nr:DNA repair ATPase [Stratiformator vulcanicus]QDT38624.1 ATPase involved in DNA repair [Stratiformator vulcanicus]